MLDEARLFVAVLDQVFQEHQQLLQDLGKNQRVRWLDESHRSQKAVQDLTKLIVLLGVMPPFHHSTSGAILGTKVTPQRDWLPAGMKGSVSFSEGDACSTEVTDAALSLGSSKKRATITVMLSVPPASLAASTIR